MRHNKNNELSKGGTETNCYMSPDHCDLSSEMVS